MKYKQIVSRQTTTENRKDRIEGKGKVLALSRQTYKLSGKSTYCVESQTCNNRYYFVRYNPSVFEWCSCKDFEGHRSEKCKHIYGVEYAIRFNTVMEVDKLPKEVIEGKGKKKEKTSQHLSYEKDTYSSKR